jgi:ribose transport system substrate-binding protein
MAKGFWTVGIGLLLTLAVTCGMAFAEGSKEKAPAGSKATYKIALSTFSEAIPWQIQTLSTAKDAAKAMGSKVDFTVVNCNLKTADQITQIENLINQKYDAILVDASSATGLAPVLKKAKAAGIVIVSYNAIVADPSVVTTRVFVDQKEWGAVMAQWLADKLKGTGNVVFFEGLSGNQISADRTAGAEEVFAKYPNIKVVAKAPGEWEQATSEAIMQGWVTAFPKIDGVWASGGASSIAAANVLLKNNIKLIPISGEAQYAWLKLWNNNVANGLTSIAPVCPPYIAQVALNVAMRALAGQKVPQDLKLPMPIVTDQTLGGVNDPNAPDEYFAFYKISQAEIDKLF